MVQGRKPRRRCRCSSFKEHVDPATNTPQDRKNVLRADEKLKKDRLGMDSNMNTPMGFLGKRKLQEFGAELNKRADEMITSRKQG
jgi:hypothetical protein